MKPTQWILTYGLLFTALAVVFSYFFLDIPLANWAHAHDLRKVTWLHKVQQLPEYIPYLAFPGIVGLSIRSSWAKLTKFENALFYSSLGYVMVNFLTKYFKMVFARTWPQTWVDNNPTWLTDGVYGFFWFKDSAAYRSFPSGHLAAMLAVVVVLCCFYRKLRLPSAIVCGLVMAGVLTNYYHFLSDIIAGAYLGVVTGLMAYRAYEGRVEK
jgi:membrane-associated phospholipid phosphatase